MRHERLYGKPINVNEMFITISKWIIPSEPDHEQIMGNEITPDDTGLLDQFEFPSIDVQAGLAIALGDEKLYRNLLQKFKNSQADLDKKFRDARE